MRRIPSIAGMALLALAACTGVPPESGPQDGGKAPDASALLANPRVMGTISLTQGGATQEFTAYDFPSSAFNATAWFGHKDGIYYLNLRAYPNQNPKATSGLLSVIALLPEAPFAGETSDSVTVKLIDHGPVADVPRWSSIGHPARLQITALQPKDGASPPTAMLAGVLTATICNLAAPADQPQCIDVSGGISTEVQYNDP